MIKNYKNYLNEQLINSDIDPFGEEDWEEDNLPPVLQIARQQGKPYNQITSLEGIENLTNLQHLSYYNNNFSKDYEKYLKNYCKKKNIYLSI